MDKIIDFFVTKGIDFGEKCLSALLLLVIGLYLSKYITHFCVRAMNRAKVEATVVTFMKSVISSVLKIIVVISAIGALGFPTTSLVAVFGTAGAALALGFKDNLGNFVSGIIILFTKPFTVGDYVEMGQYAGTVKEIQIMFTVLNTIDNKQIVVPNSQMTTSVLVNSSNEQLRRVELTFDVAYSQNIEEAKQTILAVLKKHPDALNDPEPLVRVSGYRDSSIQILLRAWCHNDKFLNLRFDLLEQVKAAFDEKGIEIPFNQLDIHMIEHSSK